MTGGGWINSPAGAYMADLTLIILLLFGFIMLWAGGVGIILGLIFMSLGYIILEDNKK